jgi:hypothetical protein
VLGCPLQDLFSSSVPITGDSSQIRSHTPIISAEGLRPCRSGGPQDRHSSHRDGLTERCGYPARGGCGTGRPGRWRR